MTVIGACDTTIRVMRSVYRMFSCLNARSRRLRRLCEQFEPSRGISGGKCETRIENTSSFGLNSPLRSAIVGSLSSRRIWVRKRRLSFEATMRNRAWLRQ